MNSLVFSIASGLTETLVIPQLTNFSTTSGYSEAAWEARRIDLQRHLSNLSYGISIERTDGNDYVAGVFGVMAMSIRDEIDVSYPDHSKFQSRTEGECL